MRHKISVGDLGKFLTVLLEQGFDGGFLTIRPQGPSSDRRFVQFLKYVGGKKTGIQSDFPRVNWSIPYYERLQENLRARGIDYRLEPTFRDDTSEFLVIDLGQDIDKAVKVAEAVLLDTFGLKRDAKLEAWFVKVSPEAASVER